MVYEQHVTTPGKKKESVQENMICLEATDRLMGFPAKPYKLHLNNPGDVLKLMKFFGKKDIAKVKKAYPKGVVTMTETSRVEWTEVKGIIWAYKPEPA